MKVLVAEDDMVSQMILQANLEKLGHEVEIASNGKEAVEKFNQNDFDIIFMDCQMPEMDGYEAAAEIRKTGSKIKIAAATGNDSEEDKQKCQQAGMDLFITKPIKIEALQSLLG